MVKDRKKIVEFSKRNNRSNGADIIEVAKYFTGLGPMKVRKLQILCFYAQAWYLACKGERFIDSDFQAWVHGPTSIILHEKYRKWENLVMRQSHYEHMLTLTDDQKAYIKAVYDMYKDYSAKELETLSKSEEPYIRVRNGLSDREPCLNVISDESIESYYKNFWDVKVEQQKIGMILTFPTQKN